MRNAKFRPLSPHEIRLRLRLRRSHDDFVRHRLARDAQLADAGKAGIGGGFGARPTPLIRILVAGDEYGLDDESSAELIRRVEVASPGEPESATTLGALREAQDAQSPAALDEADLALIGVVLDAWFQETDGALPGDAEELRLAVARRLEA